MLKANVYTVEPSSIDALQDNIKAFICEISAEIMKKNWGAVGVNIQILNSMDRSLNSNKDFMHFLNFMCFFVDS